MQRSRLLLVGILALSWGISRGDEPEIGFSHERGFYDAPFTLRLETASADATILYTLNGRSPLSGGATTYRDGIRVDRTTVVRAALSVPPPPGSETPGANKPPAKPPSVFTHTFLFPSRVAEQPAFPNGYPRSFLSSKKGRTFHFDYAMDAEVLKRPQSGDLSSHLMEVPSLCVAIEPADFHTLYRNHTRRGANWERAVSIELVYPPSRERFKGFKGFQIACGLRMQGGLAVDQSRKKSFRILFKKKYGAGKLRYPIFESAVHHSGSADDRFDTLVLRAGGNANWSKDDAWKQAPCTYLRDQFVRDTFLRMTGFGARGIFVHVYINGLYHGLYNLTERPDAKFLAAYFGGREEDHVSVNHSGSVAGQTWKWQQLFARISLLNLASPAMYRALEREIAVGFFSDYVLLNWAVGMGDWPYNNWYGAVVPDTFQSSGGPGSRSFFLTWDSEFAFWSLEGYAKSNPGAWVNPLFASSSSPAPRLWRALAESPEFLIAFADRVHRHCRPGGAVSDGALKERFLRLAGYIENAVVAESARWGDAATGLEDQPRTREASWRPNVRTVRSLIEGNSSRFIRALRRYGYYPRIDPPRIVQSAPRVPPGHIVALHNPNGIGTIFYTLDGSDPRAPGGATTSAGALEYRPEAAPRISDNVRIRARVRYGRDWSAAEDALLRVEGKGLPLVISELNFAPEPDGAEFLELYNRTSSSLQLGGFYLTGVHYWFPPWSQLAAGQTAVLVRDDHLNRFQKRYPDAKVFGSYRGGLANDGEEIALVDSTREESDPGQVLLKVRYAGEWSSPAAGGGFSLELSSSSLDPNRAEAWATSAERGGSPGRVPLLESPRER